MQAIGFATVGEAPRDDVVPQMREHLPADVRIVERGCLDRLTPQQVRALAPGPGEVGIVTRLRSGGEALLSHRKVLPLMQRVVEGLTEEDGADLVVVLCGADWSEIRTDRLLVNPGRLFPATVGALAAGRRLGVVKPSAGQVEQERRRYREMGIEVTVTAASPYAGAERLALAERAATDLREADVDLVWMSCVGMDGAMRRRVAEITGKPVILANALLGRVVSELVAGRQPALV